MRLTLSGLVLAAALIASHALAADPTFKLCTGGAKGNYYAAGFVIRDQARGSVKVEVVETAGSMDNLRKVEDGECHGAIVQSDAYGVYKDRTPGTALMLTRVGTLYKEYAHLLCNRSSGVDDIGDLDPKKHKVLTGDPGSGSEVTWASWVKADERYGKIPTGRAGGSQALLMVKDGREATCSLFVAGLKAPLMRQANEAKTLKLAEVDDGDFDNARDPQGNRVYTFADIPGGTYRNLQDGMLSSAVETLTVDAVLVVTTTWAERNKRGMEDLSDAILRAMPAIGQMVGG